MTKHTSTAQAKVILFAMFLLSPCRLVAAEGPIKPGDTIVVLQDTHLRVGKEKLSLVTRGTELVAEHVEDRWVWVTIEHQGKKVAVWILDRHAVCPEQAFAELVYGCEAPIDRPAKKFKRMDRDGDGMVGADEFRAATKLQIVDDLNKKLARMLGSGLGTGDEAAIKHSALMAEIADFEGWNSKFDSLEEARQLTDDFMRTRDLRRSRLAQSLVDRQDPMVRAHRTQVLFEWADKNRDGGLSLDEFRYALPERVPKD